MEPGKQDCHIDEVRCLVHDLRDYINPESVKVILDVGSRDAMESITLKDFYPDAVVYAFECNPPAIELCKRNIGERGGIILVPNAVSDINGTLEFFAIDPEKTVTTHRDGNIGASSLFVANPDYPYEKYHQEKITVESITLERWAKEAKVQEIDIMWIDLQGAELKAFRGMGDLLLRTKIIYTEIEFKEIYVGQPLFGDVDAYLSERGFCLLKLYSPGWFGNALYIRKDLVNGMDWVVFLWTKYIIRYYAILRSHLSFVKQRIVGAIR
jgi:FkbM family methyltransferase